MRSVTSIQCERRRTVLERARGFFALLGIMAIGSEAFAAGELPSYGIGRAPTQDEIVAWDLTIPPNGDGLPAGSGSVGVGKRLYVERCASCHGEDGKDPKYYVLVGGRGTLATAKPVPTVGSFWQFATTLWSYVRRTKPLDEPGTFDSDQVYAVTAYLLYMNDIIEADDVLDAKKLVQIEMPNKEGYVPDPRTDVGGVSANISQ